MEEAGSGTFKVFMPSEVGDKLLLGKYPCLRESVHSFVYREQDAVVTDARMKVVSRKYLFGDKFERHAEVLEPERRGVEIIILRIRGHHVDIL